MVVFYKRQQKAITPFILAFWLFALFVSVAHACGLNEDLSRAAKPKPHIGSEDRASPACDKFCPDDLPILAKVKAVQDPLTG
jgi:hypothetical protein